MRQRRGAKFYLHKFALWVCWNHVSERQKEKFINSGRRRRKAPKLNIQSKIVEMDFVREGVEDCEEKGRGWQFIRSVFERRSGKSHSFYRGLNSRNLTRRTEGRTISKVKWWWGGGRKQLKIHGREGDWKEKLCKEVKEKNSCRANCTVGFSDCTRLKGTLATTLFFNFKILVLMESLFTWFSLLLGKRTFYPNNVCKYEICLPTENQGGTRTRSQNVRALQDRIGIWKCWFLRGEENRGTRRKTSRSRLENQQQTQPTYDAGSGNLTRATLLEGELSHHCAIPASLSSLAHFVRTNFIRDTVWQTSMQKNPCG